jgi:hypothetical protein
VIAEKRHVLLLDRDDRILGGALMIRLDTERRARLHWSLTFLEGCRWFAGGRKKRSPKPGEWRGVGAYAALAQEK